MKASVIKAIDKLCRELEEEGYSVVPSVRNTHPMLLIAITLKPDEPAQILKAWAKARGIEGG